MESLKKIYRIGYGPSSSHTMGPAIASQRFLQKNPTADYFEVELYGSLALTGKGHLTDYIIKKVLSSRVKVIFNNQKKYQYHPNGMKFKAYSNNKLIDEWLVFSVGGGSLREENQSRGVVSNPVYPHNSMDGILNYLKKHNINLVQYVNRFEQIDEYLNNVLIVMKEAIKKGIMAEGKLPGSLNLDRKAAGFYQKYLKKPDYNTLIYCYALALSEENASGGTIVTAPTCGSCGVLPAVLFTYQKKYQVSNQVLVDALKVAGIIGNLVKNNASISGAEVGCQGEVGVACSMAAAAITYLNGGDSQMVEYAAEIALEHHLGMTCDPIDGLVQIPCIERNALSALYAINASEYALMTDGSHYVQLDSVIEVMKETGHDMHVKYRETSIGGLALKAIKK